MSTAETTDQASEDTARLPTFFINDGPPTWGVAKTEFFQGLGSQAQKEHMLRRLYIEMRDRLDGHELQEAAEFARMIHTISTAPEYA